MDNYRVVNVTEMRYMDQFTCSQLDMTSLELMEKAGAMIYFGILEDVGIDKKKDKIVIVSGTGNNGGDALVVGTHLLDNGYKVKVIVLGDLKSQTTESQTMLKRVLKYQAEVLILNDENELPHFKRVLRESTLLIDGIFGIGLTRNVKGIHQKVVNIINNFPVVVASIDIPSGINANNGLMEKVAIKADYTFIIQNYKVGNMLNDAMDYHGKVIVLDVGILKVVCKSRRFLLEKEDYLSSIPKRLNNTHKYHYGNLITIGGSKGLMGAPVFSALAALRSGAGLSSIAYKEEDLEYIINVYPDVMIDTYKNIEDLLEYSSKKDVVIFGPGLGKLNDFNKEILSSLLKLGVPMVIDADGIYYLKQLLDMEKDLSKVVITPHFGEMAMLLDTDSDSIKKDPLKHINQLIEKYKCTVVLKGSTTIIANNDVMYFSNYGNPGMATAGTGDILTGIIGALIGKGMKIIEAAKLGVLIHSMAGEYAKDLLGEESLIASDIIKYIPIVMKELKKQ